MATPSKAAVRKAAKGAAMAGTLAVSVAAVTTLVKRRLQSSPAPREESE
jgi:hypothetical protein